MEFSRSRTGTWMAAVGLALLLLSAAYAQDGPPTDVQRSGAGGAPPGWSNPRREEAPRGNRSPPSGPIARGFVFIDGQFVPGPYTLASVENGATINGQLIQFDRPTERPGANPMFTTAGPWNAKPEGPGNDRDRRRRGPPDFGPQHRRPDPLLQLRRDLEENAVAVSFAERPVVVLKQRIAEELLRIALGRDENKVAMQTVLGALPQSADAQQWQSWLEGYQAPPALITNASLIVSELERIEDANNATVVANRRLHNWAYPLTVFGMVMGVLSLGHLLKSPPKAPSLQVDDAERVLLIKATVFSLGLIVVLSMLDLVWTVLSAQAGQIREINPIGSQLIENTTLLSIFKVGATVMSCGILLALRKHLRAQWAAWWLCLICTVLTFRWLVLNSMFVT